MVARRKQLATNLCPAYVVTVTPTVGIAIYHNSYIRYDCH